MSSERTSNDATERNPLDEVVHVLRNGRDEILGDWIERVRENRAVQSGQALSEPLLRDHVPQLFDSIVDRLELNRPREEAEQLAAMHGFSRRITGYDVIETAIELCMLRRALWAHLTALDAPIGGALLAMERVDGMLDRAVITSLKAFVDPTARMLVRRVEDIDADGDFVPDGRPRLAGGNPPL